MARASVDMRFRDVSWIFMALLSIYHPVAP